MAISWCPRDVDVIVSAGADLAIIIWNVAEQQVISNLTLDNGMAIPCSISWGMPNPSGIAFIGKRGPLIMWFSTDESEQHRVTATHSEIRGFSSDVCQMRCHARQHDRVALGHIDGSISIFASGKCRISVFISEHILLYDVTIIVPLPPRDNIRAMMIVWKIRGKIIRTVLCCVVYCSCTILYAHSYEQFLQVNQGLLILV